MSNHAGVRWGPKNWGRWVPLPFGWGGGRPLETCPSHVRCPVEFVCSMSNGTSVITDDPPEKLDPWPPALLGHWRSSEPTRIDRLRTTSSQRSTVTTGLSCEIFKIDIGWKLRLFSTKPLFNVPRRRGSPWNWARRLGSKHCHQTARNMSGDIFRCLYTAHKCYRHNDDSGQRLWPRLRMESRGKKVKSTL